MELHQLLLTFIPSKEIKTRLNNKQIKVNNEAVLSSKVDVAITGEGVELGTFLYNHIQTIPKIFGLVDIKDCFGEESNIDGVKFLSEYTLISLSKKDHYVFSKQ